MVILQIQSFQQEGSGRGSYKPLFVLMCTEGLSCLLHLKENSGDLQGIRKEVVLRFHTCYSRMIVFSLLRVILVVWLRSSPHYNCTARDRGKRLILRSRLYFLAIIVVRLSKMRSRIYWRCSMKLYRIHTWACPRTLAPP
jgi:hypothetical protein